MYGLHDNYNSPGSAGPAQLDAVFGLIDAADDEFGILGIAIGKKARRKKHNKRLARILGKLKKLLDQGKMDKAKKNARKLERSVRILGKVDEGYEPSSEVEAWIQFSKDGDKEDLLEALGQVTLTGEEIEAGVTERVARGPRVPTPSYAPPGVPIPGAPPRRRRRLQPGSRPQAYTRWGRKRKIHWLSRHPRAASVAHFADPRSWVRPGFRPQVARGPLPPTHPMMQRPGAQVQARRPLGGGRRAFQAGRAYQRGQRGRQRFGGLIGIEAFNNVAAPTGHTRENILFEAIGNEAAGDIEIFGMDLDAEFGVSWAGGGYGAADAVRYGPFVKSLGAKLKVSKRKYDRAIKVGDSDAANQWLSEYQRIAAKMAEMRAKPELQTVTQARMVAEVPLFSTSTAGQEIALDSDAEIAEAIQFGPIGSI